MNSYHWNNGYQKLFAKANREGIKSLLQIIVSTCALLGWWGFFYPELALTPDTVKVIDIEADIANTTTVVSDSAQADLELSCKSSDSAVSRETTSGYRVWDFDSSLYHDLLRANRGQIVFRSKLLTDLSLFWEALQNEDK